VNIATTRRGVKRFSSPNGELESENRTNARSATDLEQIPKEISEIYFGICSKQPECPNDAQSRSSNGITSGLITSDTLGGQRGAWQRYCCLHSRGVPDGS
jgi:hypothetical protein